MFRLLRKINIASQLTLLVVFVALLAIAVVSRAAENRSWDLLRERSFGSLADECHLRGYALREAVHTFSRLVRNGADRVQTVSGAGEFRRDGILEDIFTSPTDPLDESERGAIREVCLLRQETAGKIATLRVFRAAEDRPTRYSCPADRPSNAAVDVIWTRLGREPVLSRRQLLSPLVRARKEDGLGDELPYLLALAFSLPAENKNGSTILVITIDFTRLIEDQVRRLPRHLLFVNDEAGRWIYHPDRERIGTTDDEWNLPARAAEGERPPAEGDRPTTAEPRRGIHLGSKKLPDLRYYTAHKRLPPKLTASKEAYEDLEEELLQLPHLRFSRLWEGAPSVVLSCHDPAVLDQARDRIARRERLTTGQPGTWPRPILCEEFVGHYLNRFYLDPDKRVAIGIILASAQEEMTAEVHDAIVRLWYRWFIPVLLASAGLALVSAYILTRPLRRLTEASQRLAQGDYSDDVQVVALGEVGELARTFRDMTDRIRTRERELREHLARLNTILINAADGIITFDQTGRIEHANAAAEEMFGTGPGGLIGTKVQKLMKLPQHLQAGVILKPSSTGSGGAAAQHGGTVTQLCNAVKTPGEEHRGLRQDGSTFWMEVTFSQVPLEDRRIITGIFRNVTQRKLAEERIRHLNDELDARVRLRTAQLEDAKSKLELALSQAESASAAKDRFISVVSHELRTPLTSAMGYTELLLNPRATKLRENPGPTLDKILTSCKHLLTLINDLLDVGRYTAGKPIDLAPTRFDLTSFLRGVQEMVTPLVKKNGNVLETIVPAGLGEIHNDETRLRQVLLNLLSNASKFTEKGRVCLQVERQRQETGDTLVFRVSDTGAGMTTEQVEKLFTPFYRVDNSMTRRQGGTGLGLTITKMICELMGGKIEVESVLGQGSTFTVTLPAEIGTAGRKPGGQPGSAETSAESRGTVLVIDDDVTVRHMLETYLQQEGYRVIQAATGTAGLQLAREHQPMCITLDVLMPGEDGWDVLARLKNDPATRDIPVIMLTIMEERNRGFALGATEYVTKPIDWGRLGSILCRYNPQQAPILIVEDDALQRGYLREELILAGWTVLEAANGAEALKVCETTTPSLILLDLTMPIMDGFTFLDELHRKEGGADIPVVVVTARELSDEDRRRLNRSVAQVLAKESLSKEKLLERIQAQMHAAAKVGS